MTEPTPEPGRRRRWWPEPALALAYGVVSAPIVGELVRTWRSQWYPSGDDAVHAIHAHDVFSVHTPLLGMFSGITAHGRPYVYHLGPLVFWALAIPERFFSERMGIVIGAAIVGIIAAVALVRSVGRMYGPNGALVASAITAITFWSVGRNVLAEPWNPYIGLIPLMLVFVYSLELANGAWAPLPWIALAASFVVQAHYVYIPIVLASVAAGCLLGIVARRRARTESNADDDDERHASEPGRAARRRALVAAALVTLACWILPLLDELVHRPGNLSNWVGALGHTQGTRPTVPAAWRYVAQTLGWPPLAARGPLPGRVLSDLQLHVDRRAEAVAGLVVALLLAVAVRAWRRDPPTARFATLALLLVPVTLFSVWRLPLSFPAIPAYRLVMLWPVSAFAWTALGVGIVALLASREGARRAAWARLGRAGTAVVSIAGVLASLVAVIGAPSMGPTDDTGSRATRTVVSEALAHLPHGPRYRLRSVGGTAYFVQYGLMRAMLDHGYRTFMPPDDVQLGRYYASNDPHDSILLVTDRLGGLQHGERVVAEYDTTTPAERATFERSQAAAVAALRAEPLRLTPYGEQLRRRQTGLVRAALDAVAKGTVTPDLLLDAALDPLILASRLDPDHSREPFVVGPEIVPTLGAYVQARSTITGSLVRVILVPPA